MKRMSIVAIAATLLIIITLAAAFMLSRNTPTAAVRVVPEHAQALVGQEISVNITVSDVKDLFGWEIKLKWNTTVLEARDISEGEFLKASNTTFFYPQLNNTAGYAVAVCTFVNDIQGVDGTGVLATLTFRVRASGSCYLDLYETMLLDSGEKRITHTVVEGKLTGTSPTEGYNQLLFS